MNAQSLFSTFKSLDSNQWALIESKNLSHLVNNYTGDEFEHQFVNLHSWHLLEVYKTRVDYCIPNSPQVILPKEHRDKTKIQILVQTGSADLQKYLRKNQSERLILHLFRSILRTAEMLVKKYGYFRFTRHMIKVTAADNFLFWINSSFSSNHRQLPLHSISHSQGARQIVNDLVAVFKYHNFSAPLQAIIKQIKILKSIDFDKIRNLIDSQLDGKKKSLIQKYKSPQFLRNKSQTPKKQKNLLSAKNQASSIKLKTSQCYERNLPSSIQKKKSMHIKSHSELPRLQLHEDLKTNRQMPKDPKTNKNQQILYAQKKSLKNSTILKNSKEDENFLKLTHENNESKKFQALFKKGFTNNSNVFDRSNDSCFKKNQFRQSANSQATTNFFTTSMTSSGKTKPLEVDNFSILTIHPVPYLSSFDPEKERKTENMGKYNPRASKIIEQNHEDPSPSNHSMVRSDFSGLGRSKSEELMKDFDNLMRSETPRNSAQFSKQLHELQSALDSILNG